MLKITWCQRVELFLGFLQSHFPNKAWFLFGDLKEKKKNILLDIVGLDEKEQERNFSLKLAARRTLRKGELEEVLLKEEVFWRQKSKINWIKEGDCNSKFFHKVANGKRNKKFIKSLVLEDGVVLDNIESISEEIKHHFGKLFSKPSESHWRIEGLDWSLVSAESVVWLDRPFSKKDIHNVVLHLNKEKAPGPNGFTISFLSRVLGDD